MYILDHISTNTHLQSKKGAVYQVQIQSHYLLFTKHFTFIYLLEYKGEGVPSSKFRLFFKKKNVKNQISDSLTRSWSLVSSQRTHNNVKISVLVDVSKVNSKGC